MSELPRRPVDPLPPPPGAFDQVLQRATERRHRRTLGALGVVTIFLVGIGGGASLDSGVRTVPGAILDYAAEVTSGSVSSAPEPRRESRTAASDTRDLAVGSAAPRGGERDEQTAPPAKASPDTAKPEEGAPAAGAPAATAEKTTTRPPKQLRLVAVGTDGTPAAGLYVYPAANETWAPVLEPAGRTATDGTFTGPCPGTPVLISPWPLHGPVGPGDAAAPWAATFVGGATQAASAIQAPCTRGEPTTVVLQPGSAVTGTAEVPDGCEPDPLAVRLHGSPTTSVTLAGVRDGDPVRVAGLPPGRHTVVLGQRSVEVTLSGGEDAPLDLTYGCDRVEPNLTPSSTPEASPDPATPSAAEPEARPGTPPTPADTVTSSRAEADSRSSG